MKQNIYDNDTFFNGYSKLRENDGSANDLFEKPALFSLLPSLENKTVRDIKTPRLIQFNYSSADFAA